MENNDMIGAVEEYVLQNTKKRMNAGELKAERIEEHDMLNWVKANRKVLNAGKMKTDRVEKFRKLLEMTGKRLHDDVLRCPN